MNNEVAIFEPQSVGTIAQVAPQAYNENTVSHDQCLQFGQQLLDRVNASGMNDEIDQEIAVYIERARKTVKKMNTKRSAVTQIFDSIRSAYTALENDIDPSKKGTLPEQLQGFRNAYAARKREEKEAELRKRMLEQAKANAKAKYTSDVEEDYLRQFNALLASACNRLTQLDRSITLDNYDSMVGAIRNTPDELPDGWYDNLRPEVLLPTAITIDESREIAAEVKKNLRKRFAEQYSFGVESSRNDIMTRLPSKRVELERIAAANAEEAERIRKQMEDRERMEAEQREKERAEREAKEKAAAELEAQRREMNGLFGAAEAQVSQYQPKVSVKKRINVLEPDGFMQVVGMWWAQYGYTLSVDELSKIFSKQLTFCNKLANSDNPVLISSDLVEYVDDVKAK